MRLRIDLGYDGTHFHGWASQPGLRTVQEVVEEALRVVLHLPSAPQVTVAGRTDAGVHARRQVVHVDVESVDEESFRRLQRQLNGVLPDDVQVHDVVIAPPGFVSVLPARSQLNPKVKFGNFSMHSGQRMEVVAPIRVGDVIAVAADVKEVYPKTGRSGTMVFEVRRNTFRNQHGEVVAISEMAMVHRQAGGG